MIKCEASTWYAKANPWISLKVTTRKRNLSHSKRAGKNLANNLSTLYFIYNRNRYSHMQVSNALRIEAALSIEFITGLLTVYLGNINPLYAIGTIIGGSAVTWLILGDMSKY